MVYLAPKSLRTADDERMDVERLEREAACEWRQQVSDHHVHVVGCTSSVSSSLDSGSPRHL